MAGPMKILGKNLFYILHSIVLIKTSANPEGGDSFQIDSIEGLLKKTEVSNLSDDNVRRALIEKFQGLVMETKDHFKRKDWVDVMEPGTGYHIPDKFFHLLKALSNLEKDTGVPLKEEIYHDAEGYSSIVTDLIEMLVSLSDADFVEFMNAQNISDPLLGGATVEKLFGTLLMHAPVGTSAECRKKTLAFVDVIASVFKYKLYLDEVSQAKTRIKETDEIFVEEDINIEVVSSLWYVSMNFLKYQSLLKKIDRNKHQIPYLIDFMEGRPVGDQHLTIEHDSMVLFDSNFVTAIGGVKIAKIKSLKLIGKYGPLTPEEEEGLRSIKKVFDFSGLETLVISVNNNAQLGADAAQRNVTRSSDYMDRFYILDKLPLERITELKTVFLDADTLEGVLEKAQNIKSLDVNNVTRGVNKANEESWIRHVKKFDNLEKLVVDNAALNPEDVIDALKRLKNPSKIKTFGLSNWLRKRLSNAQLEEFSNVLSKMTDLEELYMFGNGFVFSDFIAILDSIKDKEALNVLNFSNNEIASGFESNSCFWKSLSRYDINLLFSKIGGLRSLKYVDLSFNEFSNPGSIQKIQDEFKRRIPWAAINIFHLFNRA